MSTTENTTMVKLDRKALLERLTEQPELFALDEEAIGLVRAAKTYEPTGDRVTNDGEKVAGIVLGKMMGWSDRRIAREVHVGRNSIGPAVLALEGRGLLEPLKDRCRRWLGELTEQTILRAREELGEDKTDAGLLRSLWVGAGIGTDKLGDQAPAATHQHLHVHAEAASESVRDLVRRLKGEGLMPQPPSDSESDRDCSSPTHYDRDRLHDAICDATDPAGSGFRGLDEQADSWPGDQPPEPAEEDRRGPTGRDDRGGGVAAEPEALDADGPG